MHIYTHTVLLCSLLATPFLRSWVIYILKMHLVMQFSSHTTSMRPPLRPLA